MIEDSSNRQLRKLGWRKLFTAIRYHDSGALLSISFRPICIQLSNLRIKFIITRIFTWLLSFHLMLQEIKSVVYISSIFFPPKFSLISAEFLFILQKLHRYCFYQPLRPGGLSSSASFHPLHFTLIAFSIFSNMV
jgi:hypothetical protein